MTIRITKELQDYWNQFCLREDYEELKNFNFEAWSFGNTKEMATELGALVVEGKKRATCSLLRAYKGEEDQIPQVGIYSLLVDGDEKPLCIIFLKETFIKKFNEVDAEFAYAEGEGDRSYAHWRRVHLEFFGPYEGFTEDDLLVCEKFDAFVL
jgi:uncharacterized protein YhfF